MKRAVITGTEGFIGSHLSERLSDSELLKINENSYSSINWKDKLKKELLDFSPSVIFHVGACTNTLETNVDYLFLLNFESTKFLSDFASQENIPLIYSSHFFEYSENGYKPHNLYEWSKYTAENYVTQNGGLALRYTDVYGFNEINKNHKRSLIYNLIKKTPKSGEEMSLFPNKQKRDYIYIEDIIDVNIYAYENFDEYHFDHYDIGFGESYTQEDILDILDIKNFKYSTTPFISNGYDISTNINVDRRIKGWSPKYDILNGIMDLKNKFDHQTAVISSES
jgi:ADP-L-glycero-D-manno-heptose 6-epimerase